MARRQRQETTRRRNRSSRRNVDFESAEEEVLGTRKKKRKNGKFGKFIKVLLVLVLILAPTGYYFAQKYNVAVPFAKVNNPYGKDSITILVVGGDKRGDLNSSRADTIMLARVDFVEDRISLLSVPRDTKVNVDGKESKINATYGKGGENGITNLKNTIEKELDVQIDETVELNFETFKETVDLVGGITLTVENNGKGFHVNKPKTKIDLEEGTYLMNGDQALQFVRFRSTANSDLDRVKRQQEFLETLGKKIASEKNIYKKGKALNQLLAGTDTSISAEEASFILRDYSDSEGYKIFKGTVPNHTKTIDGVSYVLIDEDAPQIVNKYLDGLLFPYLAKEGNINFHYVTQQELDLINQGMTLEEAQKQIEEGTSTATDGENTTTKETKSN